MYFANYRKEELGLMLQRQVVRQVKLLIQYSQSELDALAKSIDGRIDSTLLEDVMKVPPSADIMERVNIYVEDCRRAG